MSRLIDATGIYGDFSYTYDAHGNRLSEVINSFPETYTYDTVSHHLLQTVNGGTRNYSYDANGNTTDNTDRQFTYGNNNRLKEAQIAGSPLASYTYNGRGERVKKTGTETMLYYYDQSGQLIAELDTLGNTLREYIYVDGQPLAYVTNGSVNFIHVDHLGTPQVISDASQQVVWQADYEPFGQVNITTETVTNNLRFAGQYFDAETGLHHNGTRDYSTEIGRYFQSDLIGLSGGINTYTYVLGNPIKYIDPEGEFAFLLPGIAGELGSTGSLIAFNAARLGILGVLGSIADYLKDKFGCKPEECPLIDTKLILRVPPNVANPDQRQVFGGTLQCIYQCPTKGQVIEDLRLTGPQIKQLGLGRNIPSDILKNICKGTFGDPILR